MESSLHQLLSQMHYAQQGEGFQLYDESFHSDESRAVHLESYHSGRSESVASFGELDFVSRTILNKVESLKVVISDIQHQLKQRAQLEFEILKDIDRQISSVRNEKLRMESFFQQNIPRPHGMESGLMQQEHILISRGQDARSQTFRDVALLKQELRQRFLELQESQSVLSGFRELM